MRSSDPNSLKGARVLIVEDEFLLADDLAQALRNAGATPLGPVSNVVKAQDLVDRERPDAAILDLNLRGSMASEFIQRLTAADLPCLIVSGYGDEALPESIKSLPRLEKPVNPSAVLDRLAAQIVAES